MGAAGALRRELPSLTRQHRILGWLAVLHAVALWGMLTISSRPWWYHRLWTGMATLWIIWPIILILHRGRSILRVALPLAFGVAILWFCRIPQYYLDSGGIAFGLPPGVKLTPCAVISYFVAYQDGRNEAKRDLQVGRLAIETYGLPLPADYGKILRERYGIELKRFAGDIGVTAQVIGHAKGYNALSEAEITRRFGEGTLKQVERESLERSSKESPP
jgi:hypothetical protein